MCFLIDSSELFLAVYNIFSISFLRSKVKVAHVRSQLCNMT